MISPETLHLPVTQLAKLIKRKKLLPTTLTEAYLAKIEKLNSRLHAFATVTADLAMQQAQQANKEISAGFYRGPLHGIPYAAKDLFAVKGYATTWGARAYASQMIDDDATVIVKLRNAGAILLGKCAMSELAGGPPNATATGACRTPWDLSRWSGGSSSGSGAAVAAGLASFALGTETWGSIMTPASFCGVTGLRPTFGRISRSGTMSLSWTMDKVGVLARDAIDCSVVFDIVRGRDPEDQYSAEAPFKPKFTRASERVSKLRVGFVTEDYEKWGEPDVAKAFEHSLRTLRQTGVEPFEVELPHHAYESIAETIIAAEQAAAFEPLIRSEKVGSIIDPDRRGELLGGQLITAVDYLRCQRLRTLIARDFTSLLSKVDIILASSTLKCAPPVDADMNSIFGGGNIIEAAENLLGLPAVSIPCGFNKQKLPIGLKIIGRPFAEADVLEFAHVYQSLTDWHTRHPKL